MSVSRPPSPTNRFPRAGARVSAQVDRAQRVAKMLDRWDAEDVEDEPEWEVEDAQRITLRSSGS